MRLIVLIIFLIYLIGVVIHLLIINPKALERAIKENPDLDPGFRPSEKQILVYCLLWPIILFPILFGKKK